MYLSSDARNTVSTRELSFLFVFKVGQRAQSAHDDGVFVSVGVVHEQTFPHIDLDIGNGRRDAPHLLAALFERNGAVFSGVCHHADHNALEHFGRAADHIKVAERDRIKAAGANGCLHQLFPLVMTVSLIFP